MKDHNPFFILGCVRSGTTMLRDVLRTHVNLVSPEETHFYRWGEPFGTDNYKNTLIKNKDLKAHRKLDGISESEFSKIISTSKSKKELTEKYITLFSKKKNRKKYRWFDKTPQNIYGLILLAADFPEAKFIHIIRNPLNVCASLKKGKVMKVKRIEGAINYWLDSIKIASIMQDYIGDKFYQLEYRDLCLSPETEISQLCNFLSLKRSLISYNMKGIHKEKNNYPAILTKREVLLVHKQTKNLADKMNISLEI